MIDLPIRYQSIQLRIARDGDDYMRSCFDPTVEVTYDAKDARLCYKKLKKNIESIDCDGDGT